MQKFFPHSAAGIFAVCLASVGAQTVLAQQTEPLSVSSKHQTKISVPAAVQVQGAWIRATVPGQKVAAAYMQLQTQEAGMQLLSLCSPVAASVQVHDMQMQGDVMRMVELKTLGLPKGQIVQLAPGGKHIMLMGLNQPLQAGQSVQLELRFQNGRQLSLHVPVLHAAPAGADMGKKTGAEPAANERMSH